MSDQKQPEGEWLRRIVARMERARKKLPEPYWLTGEWPTWVTNVARELGTGLFPTAKLKVGPNWTPGEVGAILGQQIAYAEADLPELCNGKRPQWREMRKLFGKDIKKRVETFARKWERDFLPDRVRAIKFALSLALVQDYHESARFFAAFGRAIQRKPSRAGDIGRTSTQIYVFFLIFWRSVEKLKSVRELHTVLCKIFGSHLVGDLKRVEKMCQRLELRFAQRGRPKKLQIQTS